MACEQEQQNFDAAVSAAEAAANGVDSAMEAMRSALENVDCTAYDLQVCLAGGGPVQQNNNVTAFNACDEIDAQMVIIRGTIPS